MSRTVVMRLRVTFVIVALLWILSIASLNLVHIRNTTEWSDERTDRTREPAMDQTHYLRRRNDELNELVRTYRNILNHTRTMVANSQQNCSGLLKDLYLFKDPVTESSALKPNLDHELSPLRPSLDHELSPLKQSLDHELSPLKPSLDHELKRRDLEDDITEYMMFIKARLRAFRATTGPGAGEAVKDSAINRIAADVVGYQKALARAIERLRDINDNWRRRESMALGELVQKRLVRLQNPKNCSTAKKLVCNPTYTCGYGCQLHHVTFCLVVAYATERTLIMKSNIWKNSPYAWQSEYMPLSSNCTYDSGQTSMQANQVINMQPITDLRPMPEYLPLAVPDDLADRIMLFHAAPSVWWIGQFVKYLTRPQMHLNTGIEEMSRRLGFSSPIVGVHIRRTDKIVKEAEKHELAEYMEHVEDWYQIYESQHPGVVRRVYLATDEQSVQEEARARYAQYEFINDSNATKMAADANSRNTDASLRGIIADIHFLSRSDFLVCTFSSNVCRAAYELMQTLHGDASGKIKSLDDSYYFHVMNPHQKIAIYDHVPMSANEMELRRDDVIAFFGNHWDGYSMGNNQRTGTKGLYPSYKVKDTVKRVKMPTYDDVT